VHGQPSLPGLHTPSEESPAELSPLLDAPVLPPELVPLASAPPVELSLELSLELSVPVESLVLVPSVVSAAELPAPLLLVLPEVLVSFSASSAHAIDQHVNPRSHRREPSIILG
jgi:hypothetical protein